MVDVARDASGLTSSEPAGIALQQASGPASSDKGKLRVFISYSRDDLKFADQLDAALNLCGFECLIDRHGISGGEDWKRRLGNLISEADTVVFVLSPSSARSEICDWEVEEAARLNKRVLPVICRPLERANPPSHLRDLNYIFLYEEPNVPGSGFGTGLTNLVAALNTDFDWLRKHTRYLQRAMEWDAGGRPANRLLSGDDIVEAKAWGARRPKGGAEPTALQLDFIRASEEEAEARLSEQRKQLEAMAAAQAERETALQEREEALKQRAKVAKVRNFALVALSFFFLLAVAATVTSTLYYFNAQQQKQTAEQQRTIAEQQRIVAEERVALLERATNIISKLQTQMDSDTKKQTFALFETGAKIGDPWAARKLGSAYAVGIAGAKDFAKAREWYEKAAAKDDPAAMNSLGVIYADGQGVPQDYAKAREWFEKAAAKDDAGAMSSLGVIYTYGYGVPEDYAKAREWYEKAAAKDDAWATRSLGWLYEYGKGVLQDYTKARELYEKAVAKDDAGAMHSLGWLYGNGHGVPQDYAKAREWFEKAAAKDDAGAMNSLGVIYTYGYGVPLDYAKAREWYAKAAAKDDASANSALERLLVREAFTTGRYAEALQSQEAFAAKVEAEETKREGKPGQQTVGALTSVTWYALFAKEFTKALTIADRSHALFPDDLVIETNRAHALMFMGHDEEAKMLYLAHKGERLPRVNNKLWEQAIVEDYEDFRKASLTHPMMVYIEKELGVSHPDDAIP